MMIEYIGIALMVAAMFGAMASAASEEIHE